MGIKNVICVAGLIGVAANFVSHTAFASPKSYSPQERLVRLAYAKLSFYQKLYLFKKWALKEFRSRDLPIQVNLAERYEGERVRVQISDVRVGDIQEVLETPMIDLVTPVSNWELDADVVESKGVDDNRNPATAFLIDSRWSFRPNPPPPWPRSLTLRDVLAAKGKLDKCLRYARYRVDVRFQGKHRNYKALFLFMKPGTMPGFDGRIWIIDNVINMMGLLESLHTTQWPRSLWNRWYLNTPTGRAFREAEMSSPIKEENCDPELLTDGICCDLELLDCKLVLPPPANAFRPRD